MAYNKANATEYTGVKKITKAKTAFAKKNIVGKFRATITGTMDKYFGKQMQVGIFNTAREAAVARDKKILSLGIDEPLQILKPKKWNP
jgi:hypothetical protein